MISDRKDTEMVLRAKMYEPIEHLMPIWSLLEIATIKITLCHFVFAEGEIVSTVR